MSEGPKKRAEDIAMKGLNASIIVLAGAAWYVAARLMPDSRPAAYVTGTWFGPDYMRFSAIVLSIIGGVAWLLSSRSAPRMIGQSRIP